MTIVSDNFVAGIAVRIAIGLHKNGDGSGVCMKAIRECFIGRDFALGKVGKELEYLLLERCHQIRVDKIASFLMICISRYNCKLLGGLYFDL